MHCGIKRADTLYRKSVTKIYVRLKGTKRYIFCNLQHMHYFDAWCSWHYNDVTMSHIATQITSLTIVYSTVYSVADQRRNQSSAPLAFVRGIHRGPVNSPHKGPVTRKMFPFDDVIMAVHDFVPVYLMKYAQSMFGIVSLWLYKQCCLDSLHVFILPRG